MKKISKSDIIKLSKLAKVSIDKSKLSSIQDEISEILDHLSALKEIDTSKVKSTSQSTDLKNIFNDDEVQNSLFVEDVISATNNVYNNLFKIDAILNKDD